MTHVFFSWVLTPEEHVRVHWELRVTLVTVQSPSTRGQERINRSGHGETPHGSESRDRGYTRHTEASRKTGCVSARVYTSCHGVPLGTARPHSSPGHMRDGARPKDRGEGQPGQSRGGGGEAGRAVPALGSGYGSLSY